MGIQRLAINHLPAVLGMATFSAALTAISPPEAKAVLNTFSGLNTQICSPGSTRAAGNSCGETTILRSYPQATTAEKNFLASLVGVQTETFQQFNPPAGLAGTNAAGETLTFNGGAVQGTINPTANVTLNRVTYGNTLQGELGGGAGGGQYGIAPNSQCALQTAVNVNPSDPGCLNTQQQVPFVQPGSGPNPQNFLRGAATTNNATSFSITFNQPIAAFGFYAVDLGDFNATIALTLLGGNRPAGGTQIAAFNPQLSTTCNINPYPGGGLTGTQNTLDNRVYNNCNGAVLFFGVVGANNETFNQVRFSIPGGTAGSEDGFVIDNITVGRTENVVPAPLPAAGLLPLGVAIRSLSRKRKRLLASS